MATEIKVRCPLCGSRARYESEDGSYIYYRCINCKELLTLPFEEETEPDEQQELFDQED